MHANHRDIFAAIGPAAGACSAVMTGNIRDHRHTLPDAQFTNLATDADNLAAYFMPQHPRVAEEGLLTRPGVDIGTANAYRQYF
ncbi:hypothetical protein D3C78_1542670 [compost metagenome]